MSDDIRRQVHALMAHTEEQQKAIDKALKTIERQQQHLGLLQNELPKLAVKLFEESLTKANASVASNLEGQSISVARELKKASYEASGAAKAIKEESKALGWKHAFMVVGSILGACSLIILGSTLLLPSFSDIAERKATLEQLNNAGGALDIKRCKGKLCARVMVKQCEYGEARDYCVLDLKD